ncbi:hypothetical protein TNCV_330701 [Trichonephila clavipes]|nr:hypothetical protein TNCV_330701 [Trichonephila clavipes]
MEGGHLTGHDVLVDDLHVIVSIRSGVLVPEAHHVAKLVHHNTKLVAVLADGNSLRAVAALTHERTTPAREARVRR